MSLETDLVESVRGTLEGWGVDCTIRYEPSPLIRADATLALRWGGARQRFAIHALSSVRMAAVLAAVGEASLPVLIAAPWISPRMGAQLQAVGIAYVDSVGNASLRFGTVLIEVTGRKRPPVVEVRGGHSAPTPAPGLNAVAFDAGGFEAGTARSTTGRSGRLLTPAHRKVIAALVADASLETAPLRDVAAAAGVSVGQAHKTVALLASAGYHRGHLADAQRESLTGVLDAVAALEGQSPVARPGVQPGGILGRD